MDLGRFGVEATAESAREEAIKLKARIFQGADPLGEKKKVSQGETVNVLCDRYLEDYAKRFKKSWPQDESRINAYIRPAWGTTKIQSIRHEDVAALHNKIGKNAVYEANRVLALVSILWTQAERMGFVPRGADNPARGVARFPEKKRDRFVSKEEMPALFASIKAERNQYVQFAVWLFLFLGLRKSELLSCKWEDIDFQRMELRIPDSKSGKHLLPLSSAAVEVLKRIPRIEGNPYLLPGRIHGAPLVNISKPWNSIRERAGLEDVRLHDLRRTVGSWLAQSGNSLHLIKDVLNHKDSKTTEVYAHFSKDHLRAPLEKHGQALIDVANQEIPKKTGRKLIDASTQSAREEIGEISN